MVSVDVKQHFNQLPQPTDATVEEKRNACTARRHPIIIPPKTTDYHSSSNSRHIIVKKEQREGQENLEWDGFIGSLARLLQSGSASHILIKDRLLHVSRTNYAPRFTR